MKSEHSMGLPKHLKAELALLSLTIVWGVSFPVIKIVLHDMPPALFLFYRFLLALLLTLPFVVKNSKPEFSKAMAPGLLLGAFLGFGFLTQTIGLVYTTATKNAFITALYIIFVPLLFILIYRKKPGFAALSGAFIALIGLYFLTSPTGGPINIGDILTLITAFLYALFIIYIEIFSRRYSISSLVFWQLAGTIPIYGVYTVFFESHDIQYTTLAILTIIVMAALGTTLPAFVQTALQKNTTPNRAAVIFSGEAVFAAIASYFVLNEMYTLTGWIGAALIFSGILFCEIGKPVSQKTDK